MIDFLLFRNYYVLRQKWCKVISEGENKILRVWNFFLIFNLRKIHEYVRWTKVSRSKSLGEFLETFDDPNLIYYMSYCYLNSCQPIIMTISYF